MNIRHRIIINVNDRLQVESACEGGDWTPVRAPFTSREAALTALRILAEHDYANVYVLDREYAGNVKVIAVAA